MNLSIARFDPERDERPFLQDYDIERIVSDHMLLDVLLRLKTLDPTLSFRKSCWEGVCGSDAMNINGRNGLACVTRVSELREPVVIRPLPGFSIIRDLFVDLTQFFNQYHSITPYLINDEPPPEKERLQTPAERHVRQSGPDDGAKAPGSPQRSLPNHRELRRTGAGACHRADPTEDRRRGRSTRRARCPPPVSPK